MAERSVVETAVIVIETPDSFVLQKRPNLPGKLAYPGKFQFLGGHVEADETGLVAAAREFGEETNSTIPEEALSQYAEREFEGRGKNDEPVLRHVTVCYLGLTALANEQLELQEQGELVRIGKTAEDITAHEDDLTPFAKEMLTEFIKNKTT